MTACPGCGGDSGGHSFVPAAACDRSISHRGTPRAPCHGGTNPQAARSRTPRRAESHGPDGLCPPRCPSSRNRRSCASHRRRRSSPLTASSARGRRGPRAPSRAATARASDDGQVAAVHARQVLFVALLTKGRAPVRPSCCSHDEERRRGVGVPEPSRSAVVPPARSSVGARHAPVCPAEQAPHARARARRAHGLCALTRAGRCANPTDRCAERATSISARACAKLPLARCARTL